MSDDLRRPQPLLDDVATDLFWSGALDHRLTYQHCSRCSAVVFYPRAHCPSCGHADLVELASSGAGSVHSWTTIAVHPDPYFAARVPYAVALVELDEGFRMVCEVVGDTAHLGIGARVALTWDDTQDVPVPLFALTPPSDDLHEETT